MPLLTESQQDYYQGNVFGNYQFTSLDDIINQFIVSHVGEDKIISKVKRTDVAFHAQRAMQELSFDTFKSIKSQEITLPPSLTMKLPQDYVNYTRVLWTDSSGIKHPLYPTKHTQNPPNPYQNSDGDFELTVSATMTNGSTAIVLDDIYHNIPVGSTISGPNIGTYTVIVNQIQTTTGKMELQFVDNLSAQNYYIPTSSFTETLTVSQPGGSTKLLLTTEDVRTPSISSTPFTAGNNVITFDNASDTEDIEIGMVINYFPSFGAGTTVTGVNGKYVTVSSNSTLSPTSTPGILFTSQDGSLSDTWKNYKGSSSSTSDASAYNYDTDVYDLNVGQRYGLEPSHSQTNGSYYIDNLTGLIHFSSNCLGKTIVLDYISDSLGTDDEMQVHKFAEEAIYKWIAHAILATRANVPEYQVARFKKERAAAIRTAKLRLSNIKIEELTQVLRGKSKWIKH
jgi:hypothetical protein